ncbi:acyltransferase family protein [Tabrizicola sp.]|uniref:acyltransferase family protein n=1 Tax=Tabrizicola sp. TaxID=2005166 RepID=UPI00286BA68A|nr:acyltransferase family protein [Tabrizicola sp.]
MPEQLAHRAEIDGLRAIAVLSILANHAGAPFLPGGFLGVDIFFVISGFVITRLLQAELTNGTFSFTGFYRRRARRILPALVTLLLVCLPLGWGLMSPDQFGDFLQTVMGAALLVPNFVLWQQTGYFAQEAAVKPLLHLWSLGVEEQFYLLFPLVLWGLWRAALSARAIRWVLRLIGLASMIIATWMLLNAPSAGFYLLPSRIWELTVGAGAALTQWQPRQSSRQVWSLLGIAMIVTALLLYTGRVPTPGPTTLLPVLGTALCLIAARSDTWVGRGLAMGPMVWVGLISYGTYLWHWPLLAFVRIVLVDEPQPMARAALMAAALVLGWASWRFIETPFRRNDRPWLAGLHPAWWAAPLLAVALLAAAAMFAEENGWRQLDWPGFQTQQLADIKVDVAAGAKYGLCHYYSDSESGLAAFREQWDCHATGGPGLVGWPVGVFGDSNAANFVLALRETGRNPMQMTASGCSIAPSLMSPRCQALAADFIAAAHADGIRTVILVNFWVKGEVTPEALRQTVTFWRGQFDHVVLVSPLPNFPKLEEKLLRYDRTAIAALEPDEKLIAQFLEGIGKVPPDGLLVIDSKSMFCGARRGCTMLGQGPLMTDSYNHLSREGARLYGTAMDASGVLTAIEP